MGMVLPIVTFCAGWLLFWIWDPVAAGGWRRAYLKTMVGHGVAIVVLTELLSSWHLLTTTVVTGMWLAAAIATVASVGISTLGSDHPFPGWNIASSRGLGSAVKHVLAMLKGLPPLERAIVAFVATTLVITLFTALWAAPNNWDAMVYHLPRVMHWIQNQSVAHYPSLEVRQLAFMPGASYWVMQLHLLAGSDRFANFPQWLAFLGCILGTSLLAEQCSGQQGFGQRAGWLAALLCASLPMAVMQSTTPQTDLLTAFWLVCLAYFVLAYFVSDDPTANGTMVQNQQEPWHGDRQKQEPRLVAWFLQHQHYWWIAASLGLGIVTKQTAWIFSIPIVLALAWRIARRQRRSSSTIPAAFRASLVTLLISISSLILILPSCWRNVQTFGSFSGGTHGTTNEGWGLMALVSNLLKNLALSIPLPGYWQMIAAIHQHVLHTDIESPLLNFAPTPLAAVDSSPTEALLKVLAPHEDFVGYPVHLLLFGIAAIALIQRWLRSGRTSPHPALLLLTITVITNFLLVCLLLKWQPWGNRLLLPIAVLAVAVIADGTARWHRQWQRLMVAGLGMMAIAYALTPMRHPLVALPVPSAEQSPSILTLTRPQMYFSGARKELAVPYAQTVSTLQTTGCTHIGIALGAEAWEYPLWALLKTAIPTGLHIQHFNVQPNTQQSLKQIPTSQIDLPNLPLCGVVVLHALDGSVPTSFKLAALPATLTPSPSLETRQVTVYQQR